MFGYVAAVLVGALAMFFLDPERGSYRRNVTRDRLAGTVRRSGARAERIGLRVASDAYGVREKVTHLDRDDAPPSDAALTQKVMTELFRDSDIPKGHINIDSLDGIVTLRGQVELPDQIRHIESRVRRIDGVRDVENLLHQPGTPAR